MFGKSPNAGLRPSRPAVILSLGLLLLAAWTLRPALAADPVVVARGPGTEFSPVAAVNTANGQYLAVWFDVSANPVLTSNSYSRVFARRLDASGNPLGAAFVVTRRVLLDPTLGGGRPAVAYNSSRNEFLVVYDRQYEGATEPGIYAQRISAQGAAVGGEITVATDTSLQLPRIAYDSISDRYFVVFGGPRGIVGTFLTGLGTPVGLAALFGPADASAPALAFNPASERFLLAYSVGSGDALDVLALVLNRLGSLTARTVVSTAQGNQYTPAIAVNAAANQFLVVWTDGRDPAVTPAAYGQLLDGNGALVGENLKLAERASFPAAAYSQSTSKYLLAWQMNDSLFRRYEFIQGRLLESDLTPSGEVFNISDTKAAGRPQLALNPNSAAAQAVWPRPGIPGRSAIYARRIPVSAPAARLTLKMTATPNPARTGQEIAYTLTVANQGNVRAQGVRVEDTLPSGLDYVSAATGHGSCRLRQRTVLCDLRDLAVNQVVDVVVTARAQGFGTVTNRATVQWQATGSEPAKASARLAVDIRYTGSLALLAPAVGDVLATGSVFPVRWQVRDAQPGDALTFSLFYSLGGNGAWTRIAQGLTGDSYTWQVPAPPGNRKARMRVQGFANGRKFGQAESAGLFAIDVAELSSPQAGQIFRPGDTAPVIWTTHATRRPVARVSLRFSLNGGGNWRRIADLFDNSGRYDWTVPPVAKPARNAKVLVILRDARGAEVGRVETNGGFSILP
jgi:uncharacterized repeat protein (TIGR01451 family)